MAIQTGASASPTLEQRRIGDPFVAADVPKELDRLRGGWGWEAEGHAGRTLAKFPNLRVVLETMKAGIRVPLHEAAERMTLQIIGGRLRIRFRTGDWTDLEEGNFGAVAPALVSEFEALDECTFLLTLAWPPAQAGA